MIMEKKIFVHISDMHVAERKHSGGVVNSRAVQTFLTAPPQDSDKNYIEAICKEIKDEYKDSEFYLLVSGDIADSAEKTEYEAAKSYLEIIINELNIDKERILLVPGNHDINRFDCQTQARNSVDSSAYDCSDKYNCFADFYQQLLSKPFPKKEAVVDCLEIKSERLLFVGINSNFHIDYQGGEGYVDIELLKNNMDKLKNNYTTYTKIALFHHNLLSKYKDNPSNIGNFETDNRERLLTFLEDYNFRCVFSGNEHTPSSDLFVKKEIYYSDAGTLGLKNPMPSFKIYELGENDKAEPIFKIRECRHLNDNNNDAPTGSWGWYVNKSTDLSEIVLRGQGTTNTLPSVKNSLPSPSSTQIPLTEGNIKEPSSFSPDTSLNQNEDNTKQTPFQKEMLMIIKKNGLYHQGHFHWGKSSRSHNWIDTVTLLSNNENKKKILDEIDRFIKNKGIDYDIVIGIGIEGNILSSRLLLKDKDYTYIPYSYRYGEATKYERTMHVHAQCYRNALIITDVVFSGNTLKTLIEIKEKDFFKNKVEHVDVLSLFYTASKDQLKNGLPQELGDMYEKVTFHYLFHIEVGRCIYKDGKYKEECPNYKNHLCEVLKFYNENDE